MGKIRKTASAKHEQSLSPAIREFVKTGIEIPLWELPRHLAAFPARWPFPRGDTYHWVGLLNRFDEILAATVTAYGLEEGAPSIHSLSSKVLLNPKYAAAEGSPPGQHWQTPTPQFLHAFGFPDDGDRVLLESILDFSTLLMDNCSNRALYASSAVLGQLLTCTSLAVVAAVLRLSLRLAGRYSTMRLRSSVHSSQLPPISQPLLQQWYQLDLAKVEKLAMPFAKSPEACDELSDTKDTTPLSSEVQRYSSDLISLIKDGPDDATLEREYGTAWISLPVVPAPSGIAPSDGPVSPTPIRRTSLLGATDATTPSHHTSSTDSNNDLDVNANSSLGGIYRVAHDELMSSEFGEVLTRTLSEVPEACRFELSCRMRTARAFNESASARQQAVAVRMLAIANLAHIYPESMLQEKVLAWETSMPRQAQLPYQLRDLIHTPGSANVIVPKYLQAIAVATLEALTNHKAKATEVLACLNVNVGHGALTYLLRKVVTEMSEDDAALDDRWDDELRNALFSLLPMLPRAFPRAAESLATAGICEILVEGLNLRTQIAEENHTRILGFLDIFVYNTRDAFSSIVNAKGLDITAELLVHEVKFATTEQEAGRGFDSEHWTQNTSYKIPFVQQQILRTLFRFINHMMNFNGGAFDRLLRNLIESADVLAALRQVLASPVMFGTAVWSGAVSIVSNFLNAEPTSYAAVAEAGLTKAFLDTVTSVRAVDLKSPSKTPKPLADQAALPSTLGLDSTAPVNIRHPVHGGIAFPPMVSPMEARLSDGILPSMEAITSVPTGFGSICLNDAGLDQLRESKALKFFFFVFLSSPHVKVMAAVGSDEVESLGAQFDELVRHHPRLKTDIIQLVWHMVALLADRFKHKAGVELLVRDKDGRTVPDRTSHQASVSAATTQAPAVSIPQSLQSEDVEMRDATTPVLDQVQPDATVEPDRVGNALTSDALRNSFQSTKRATDLQYILVYSKFLLGFFTNVSFVQPFSETHGIEKLIDFVTSPLLPYDFGNSHAAHKLAKLFQIFVGSKPHLVLPRLAHRLVGALRDLEILISHPTDSSFFTIYVTSPESGRQFTDAELNVRGSGSKVMQKLLVVQVLGLILAKCLPQPLHRNSPNAFAAVNLTDLYVEIVERLGRLQTRCIWESILLEQIAPRSWPPHQSNLPAEASAVDTANNIDVGSEMHGSTQNNITHTLPDGSNSDESPSFPVPHGQPGTTPALHTTIEDHNLLAIRHLLNHIPANISMSLLTIGKSLLVGKRPIAEQYHKQNAFLVAESVGQTLVRILEFDFSPTASVKAADYYRYISVSLVTQALVGRNDAVPSQGGPAHNILSIVVQEFRKAGGLKLVGQIANGLFERSVISGPETLEDARIKGPKSDQRCSYEGLQAILRFLAHVTDQKVIEQSPQTIAMARQERDKSSPDYSSAAQLLIEMRADAIKYVKPIWESELTDQASPSTIKSICAVVKNVLEGLGEHGAVQRSDKISSRLRLPHKHWKIRSTENLSRLSTETGANEELAREALFRCMDNYAAAKDYCIAYMRDPQMSRNPIPAADLPPADTTTPSAATGGSAERPVVPETLPLETSDEPIDEDGDIVQQLISRMGAADAAQVREDAQTLPVETTSAQEIGMTTLEDLDEERSDLQSNIMDRSLMVLASFKTQNLVFELADLIIAGISKNGDSEDLRSEASETLMNSLISFQDNIQEVREDITVYAHLFGLLLQDSAIFQAAKDTLKESFGSIIAFLQLSSDHKPGDSASWMCNILLIVERVLSEDAQPRRIHWSPPPLGQAPAVEPIATQEEPLASADEKESLFVQMLDLLPKIGHDSALGLAVARIVLILTRNRRLAKRLGEKRNMARFFLMIRQILMRDMLDEKMQTAVMLTLRHVVEDEESIRHIMRSEIKALFATQSRAVDAPSYTRHLYHLVLRDPEIFVETTNELLMLPKYDKPHHAPQLALKKEQDPTPQGQDSNEADQLATESVETKAGEDATRLPEKSKAPEIKPPIVENPDGVIHFLLSELLAYKDVSDKTPESATTSVQQDRSHEAQNSDVTMATGDAPESADTSTDVAAVTAPAHAEKRKFNSEDHPIFIYRCFILSVLTELLQSYNRTKIEFINFSRRADPQVATPSKPRSGVLNYLLNGLIPRVTLTHVDDLTSEKNASLSTVAIGVVVALCSRTTEKVWSGRREAVDTDDEPDLLFVRRFVLEHALKAYRDTTSSQDPAEIKYSKLLALADMFNRMLAARQNNVHRLSRESANSHLVPTQKLLAKIMFEKNFIAALNYSLLDIDLRVPGANRVVKYILRPLNLLTHTAIELSLTSDISSSPGQTDEDEISSATSVSDAADGREETPDLFRNSTLGMFEPNRGGAESEDSDLSSEDDEQDMYEEAYADDMEYDEQEHAHEEDIVSDEDEEMDGIGPIEGIPGDVPMELQLSIDEGDDDDSIEDDDDDDNEEDSDDDDDEEDDDEDEDEDEDEIEIMEEVIGDDGASADEDHDIDEWEDEGEDEGHYVDLDAVHEIDDQAGSASDNDIEAFSGAPNALAAIAAAADRAEALEAGDLEGDDSDEGDEEDGEDYDDDEEMAFEADDYEGEDGDTDMTPFNFWPMGRHARHIRHHRHQWTAALNDADINLPIYPPGYHAYGPGRLGGQAGSNGDETTNPLLTRSSFDHNARQNGHDGTMRENNHQALHDLQRLLRRGAVPAPDDEGGAVAYINNILNTIGSTGPVGVQTNADGALSISLGLPPHAFPHHHHHHHHHHPFPNELELLSSPGRSNGNFATQGTIRNLWTAAAFAPVHTTRRWQDEAKLLFGAEHTQKCLYVVSSILRLLIPPAIEAERVRRENEKKAQAEKDKQQAEREEQERKEREAAERAEAEAAAARERAQADEAEVAQRQTGEEMQGVEPSVRPASTQESDSNAAEPTRIYTNIRGRQVDITSLGIDVEVLEALPEEMREEVIAQQYVEQRTNARESGEVEEPTSISSEFLDALPPDIREEIIQQEAQERRRLEREEARRRSQAAGVAAQPEDMDPASFMASLDPTLRATVLAEADEDMLASLPEDLAAEARALGSHHRRRVDPFARLGAMGLDSRYDDMRRRGTQHDQGEDGHAPVQRRSIVQMLDKAGIATLLRLMFVPVTGSARTSLAGILRNACGNRQTRQEVISGLLSILQDGSTDVHAAERSFSYLTSRAKQATGYPKTPPPPRKVIQASDSSPGSEANAGVAMSQCLAALVDLVRYISHVPQFFLTENEAYGAARMKASRKGKNKDLRAARYPINSLLSLLDRESVINDVAVMEQLASLLSSVTMPLNSLSRKDKEEQREVGSTNVSSGEPSASNSSAPAEQDITMTGAEPPLEGPGEPSAADPDNMAKDVTAGTKKSRALVPPEIPEENLRFVVNILSAQECSSKTFRDTLSTMTYLSAIPGARKVLGDELIRQARELGEAIHEKLRQLVKALGDAENEMEAQSLALTNFSPTGSDQSKFNRTLTALDYLFENKTEAEAAGNEDNAKTVHEDGKELLAQLHNDSSFIELWQQLGGCLSATQQSDKYFLNVATILLPLIEALMVVCKRIPVPNKSRREDGEMQDQADSKMKAVFFSFTNKHRKVLNDLVRLNPKLMSGSFSVLVKNSGVLEFDNKRNFFNRRLHHRNADQRHRHHAPLPVNVRREQVFLDSYKCLYYKSPEEIKYGKLNIHFHHEEGVDAGGVTREWFQVLARQMFNPDYALFNPVASDRTTFHPNSLSSVNPEHLPFFKFIGRIIGKALYENRVLDCHFSRAVYKRILGNAVSMKDMETIDLDYTKGMEWILHNDISDVITETFSLTQDKFGEEEIIDLIPNGRNVVVTEENKEDYVKLVTEYKLLGSVKKQLESFLEGFHEIVPAELIAIFDEGELELLISGMPDVDIDDWKTNTEYHSYNASSPQIQWFWRAVRSFDKEERAKLLQFVTGTGKVPLNGFKELEGMNGFTRFSIHKDFGNKDRLPSSHTCFNQLDLPEYDNYDTLRKSLYTAMTTGADFFGLI